MRWAYIRVTIVIAIEFSAFDPLSFRDAFAISAGVDSVFIQVITVQVCAAGMTSLVLARGGAAGGHSYKLDSAHYPCRSRILSSTGERQTAMAVEAAGGLATTAAAAADNGPAAAASSGLAAAGNGPAARQVEEDGREAADGTAAAVAADGAAAEAAPAAAVGSLQGRRRA